ncbi:MAG: carboxyl transferase domain-containing protein [Fidelibacterota bacterium]
MKHFYYSFEKNGMFRFTPDKITGLNEFEKYQLSFHPERPKYLDYLLLFSHAEEVLQSPEHGSCLIQTHRAEFHVNGTVYPVMLIGQQSGPTSDYRKLIRFLQDKEAMQTWNHGMPTPAAYERAIRAIELANKEKRLIITVVDTPGADPTEASEAGGIAWKIGKTIQELVETPMPTVSIIINRGCSGGAIALTGCDLVLAMEHSTYLVITPEACSSILFHTRSRANEAAEISQILSREGYKLGIVDEIVPEPEAPAHRNREGAFAALKESLSVHIPQLWNMGEAERFQARIRRWAGMGHWGEAKKDFIRTIQKPTSRLPKANGNGYLARHKGCYDSAGKRHYDPVRLSTLEANNYTCEVCGHRYVRPSAWDYMDIILDPQSFEEHEATRNIVDKDILQFPGYLERIEQVQKSTGLATAMITGNGTISGKPVVYCGTDFGFLGGSFCMSTGEKIWRAAEIAIASEKPMVLQACGGGARMHEGCSSMVSIPKAHLALTRVERAGLPVITLITDPTLGGVAIGYGSRGIRIFEYNAGNIGFSGKRVIEQYTGKKTSRNFQKTHWLERHGHVDYVGYPQRIREQICEFI